MDYFIMEMMSMFMASIIYLGLPFILYILVRWRDNRSETPDVQLGYKFGLHFFRYAAIQTLLIAAGIVIVTILFSFKGGFVGEPVQAAVGLAIPSGIVLLLVFKYLSESNDSTHPSVGRLFNGILWIVAAVISIGALTFMSMMIVLGEVSSYTWQAPVAMLLVAVPACFYFGKQVRDTSTI